MKKFLTVLLVIAVMFTFSFGSAFATVDYNKGLANEYFNTAMKAVKDAKTIDIGGYTVDYATLDAHRAELLKLAYDFAKAADPQDYVSTIANIQQILNNDADLALTIVAAQYAADEKAVLDALTGLNVADYSTEKISASELAAIHAEAKYATFNGETYQDFVQYLIGAATQAVKDENTMTADSAISAYVTALDKIEKFIVEADEGMTYDAGNKKINVNNTEALVAEKAYVGTGASVVGLGVYELNTEFAYLTGKKLGNLKATAVEDDKTNTAADIAIVKAEIAKEYAAYITAAGRTAAEKTAAANLKLVLDALADECIITTGEPEVQFDYIETTKAGVKTAIANVELVKAYADKMIAEKDEANATVRDAADVKDIVDEYTIYAYAIAVLETVAAADYDTYDSVEDAKEAMEIIYNDLTAEALAFEKKAVEKEVEELLAKFEYEETYYAPEFAKIKALADEYLAAVNALTEFKTNGSDNFLRLESKFTSDYGDVKTATQVDGLSGVSDLIEVAKTYYGLYNNTLKGDNKLYDNADGSDTYPKLTKEVKALVGASDARTKTAILALGDQLPALVRTLPTIAQVEAAEEAAEDAVKALPATTVKISDRATIEAAKAALKEYKTLTTKTYNDSNATATAVTKLLYAYNNEFTASAKVVDKTDKAAVTALRNEIKQVAKDFSTADDYAHYGSEYYDGAGDVFYDVYVKLSGYLTDIQEAAAEAVEKAINAIPVNLTVAAEPAVKAARAAYDAYVAEYTNYYNDLTVRYEAKTDDGFVADDFAYAELVRAEADLGLNYDAEENAKAYVQDLKIAARSVKTSKGVKVTINADVQPLLDDGFTVEYKFYRSTKSNAKFGSPKITKTTNTYLNTSGKKGTRYYYKARLVVKNAKGEVVAITPLSQCLYATRVF